LTVANQIQEKCSPRGEESRRGSRRDNAGPCV